MNIFYIQPNKTIKGGPGSGNFGHAGRPGKRGGSAPVDTYNPETLFKLGVRPDAVLGHYSPSTEAKQALLAVLRTQHDMSVIDEEIKVLRADFEGRIGQAMNEGNVDLVDSLTSEMKERVDELRNEMFDLPTPRNIIMHPKGHIPEIKFEGFDGYDGEDDQEFVTRTIDMFAQFGKFHRRTKEILVKRVEGRGFSEVVSSIEKKSLFITGKSRDEIFHELGHILETANHYIESLVFNFWRSRTEGKPQKLLSDEFPGRYRSGETFYEGSGFLHPYMSKVYGSTDFGGIVEHVYATELISMGMQEMQKNGGYALAKYDPEHWMLTFDVMKQRAWSM